MELIGKNKKRGRPPFKATRTMRNQVEIAVAGGLSAAEIAVVLGISRPTLEAYFGDELQNGRARKYAENLCRLDRAAQRGSVSAAKFLLTVFSAGTTVLVGKKVRERQAAETAGQNTEWGDDLRPVTKLQ